MAWLGTALSPAWAYNVVLEIDSAGCWSNIAAGVSRDDAQQRGATVVKGPLLPGVVNAHSHAFQRAFAGLAERRHSEHDDFWSWRDRMYRVALAISPQQLKAVASQLYLELLRGGYTHVCEFHYLHHAPDGTPYDDPLTTSWMLIAAAHEVGIGLTMLPVLYERSGFTATTLRDDQRRFGTDAAWVLDAQVRIIRHAQGSAVLNAGVAIHSLRAASPASIQTLAGSAQGPIHIHVAEQTGEVNECLKVTGLRPVEWLAQHLALDSRWQLIHATHVTQSEIDSVARSGACAVLCPTTEANLGDGSTDLGSWLNAGTTLAIGSDSHVTRDWREELRLLEYGQRLQHRARNISASPATGHSATAERLLSRIAAGGAAAASQKLWGLTVGARADALVVNLSQPALLGVPDARTLDALIFSSPSAPFDDVMVAGRWVIRDGAHRKTDVIAAAFNDAMRQLWSDIE
ncbi:MAG: formimidoylglutamate deiminase [Rhizobacter sp.]|nr:formimidoylglutamate deiminase [Burkholderiales bacterium]